jgi:hypothetical protein
VTHSLLPGDWVEVLSASEIVQSLDEDGTVAGLPFMPEMLPFAGRRFKVVQRATRTCLYPPLTPFPMLADSVVLEGLRCDGSRHGGCELGCMFLWKESWLRPVDGDGPADQLASSEAVPDLQVTRPGQPETFVCQATELPRATTPGPPLWSPGQYVHFVRDHTYTVRELTGLFWRIGSGKIMRRVRPRRPAAAPIPERSALDLQPGEWVEVKSQEEILSTLDADHLNKGLAFTGDMVQECGKRVQVLRRIETIIDERTGRLRKVGGTVLLDGSICDRNLGCARGMPFLWRENWLHRVESVAPSTPSC